MIEKLKGTVSGILLLIKIYFSAIDILGFTLVIYYVNTLCTKIVSCRRCCCSIPGIINGAYSDLGAKYEVAPFDNFSVCKAFDGLLKYFLF